MKPGEREFRRHGENAEHVGDPIAIVWKHLTSARPARLLLVFLLLSSLPAAVQAQFLFTTNNGAITITGYTGPGGAVAIPATTNGLPVTSIGTSAFQYYNNLTSVTIPNSVTNIGTSAFWGCTSLTSITLSNGVTDIGLGAFFQCSSLINVTIPASVASIGNSVFCLCTSLTNITIPNTVTKVGHAAFRDCTGLTSATLSSSVSNIGEHAFDGCTSLASVTIPSSVTTIDYGAFLHCSSLTNIMIPGSVTSIGGEAFADGTSLTAVYFQGNAPSFGLEVFYNDDNATVYYLPGTTGWSATFGDRPTALWFLLNPLILNNGPGFGVQTNGFGFIISWATNIPVVVEASTSPISPIWSPVVTNTLTSGASYFSDPQWTNYPYRLYRLRSP